MKRLINENKKWKVQGNEELLTKTRNDLKRPITNKKQPGNGLQQQQARNNQKRPTTSKTLPTTSRIYLQRAKKDAKWPATSRFRDYFTIWGNRFSSLILFQPNIWLQSFEHCFIENHGENRAPNTSILSCVFITECVANHFDTRKWTFARQKPTLWIKQ